MTGRLKDKVAIVTGAGAGIGAAIAAEFTRQGAAVVVTDINLPAAEAVAVGLAQSGAATLALEHNVASEEAWEQVIQQTMGHYGRLDVLVNNAGIGIPATIEEQTLEEFKRHDEVNVHGVFLGTQKAIAVLKESGGSIINISSIDGIIGDPKAAAYNASKGAVRTLTKSAALHCAESRYGVRINSVHPGYILTDMVEKQLLGASKEFVEEYTRLKIDRIPMGVVGAPSDIALGCVYLASDESRYVTGAELVIDGGFTAA
ncbi:MAG: 3-beta hydroxysteroid dehydrogenase [Cellvibrionaceae bacterium]|nr:3-beta hydroxysteroid dehydrogenase [Cellvibrionaceae bacterium]